MENNQEITPALMQELE